MIRLLAVVVLLILYGSLYPWRFGSSENAVPNAIRLLTLGVGRFHVSDVVVNVLFYLPVGACAYLTLRPWVPSVVAALFAGLLGTSLSLLVEILQGLAVSRTTNIYDVYANSVGSAAGAVVAAAFFGMSHRLRRRAGSSFADPGALALIVCFVAYLLFPFVPLFASTFIRLKLAAGIRLDLLALVSAAVAWYVVGAAIQAAGVRNAAAVSAASVLLVPLQLFVFSRTPGVDDLMGAASGSALFAFTNNRPGARRLAAWSMMALLVVRGLFPLTAAPHPNPFNWVPFATMLEGNWQNTSRILSEKVFFYGAAIWALFHAGVTLRTAAFGTAALLALIEGAQIWLTRTPEITDPLLALLIGVGIDAFRSNAKRTSSPSGTSASGIR